MKWIYLDAVDEEGYPTKETYPKENFDYLVLKEDGTMDVARGSYHKVDYDFQWDTDGYVIYYSKLPKRPKGCSERSLQKKANAEKRKKRKIAKENEGKTGVGTMYDIFPGFKKFMEEKYGK